MNVILMSYFAIWKKIQKVEKKVQAVEKKCQKVDFSLINLLPVYVLWIFQVISHLSVKNKLQGDLLNMAVFFWYIVKSDLSSVCYCTRVQVTFYKILEKHGHV